MTMILEFQKAVFEALDDDATLSGMVSGIFDFVLQGTEYPYVTIGNITAKDWSTLTTSGIEATLEIEVFSRERGRKECHDIMARIRTLLHSAALDVEGHTLVDMFFMESEVAQQKDGLTFKGTIVFRSHIQQ